MQTYVYVALCLSFLTEWEMAQHYDNKGHGWEGKEEAATCAKAPQPRFVHLEAVCVSEWVEHNSRCPSAPPMTTSLTPACSYLSVDGPIFWSAK